MGLTRGPLDLSLSTDPGGQSLSPYLSKRTPKWLSLLSFPQLLPGPIAAPELDGEMSSSLVAPVRPSLPTLGFGPLFVK